MSSGVEVEGGLVVEPIHQMPVAVHGDCDRAVAESVETLLRRTGVSMGRAIVTLINRELGSVVETSGDDSPVLAPRARVQLARREAEVASREQAVASAEERLRSRSEQLCRWEAELQTTAHRVELASKLAAQNRDSTPKVGRNGRCPCGSGLKYKHCHGLLVRRSNVVPR